MTAAVVDTTLGELLSPSQVNTFLACPAKWLWFANNLSAYNLLCSNTFITVVESAELRHCNDLSDAHRLSRKRTLLTEAQVGSRVMVVAEIARQCSFEVAGVHHNVMVETLPSNSTDESFGVWILPRTSGCGQNFFHSQRLDSRSNLGAIKAVPIADEITGTRFDRRTPRPPVARSRPQSDAPSH